MNLPTTTEWEKYFVLIPPEECLCCGQKFNPPLKATMIRRPK